MKKLLFAVVTVAFMVMPGFALAYTVTLNPFTGQPSQVNIEVTGDGTNLVQFDVSVVGPLADLRGIWFDLEPFTSPITFTGADVTQFVVSEDNVGNLGNGNNLNGPLVTDNFDVGVAIGVQGIGGGDDFQFTSFTISSALGPINLGDRFGARLTSVDVPNNGREGSSKLIGYYSAVPEPSTALLFGAGLAGLVGMRRRKRK